MFSPNLIIILCLLGVVVSGLYKTLSIKGENKKDDGRVSCRKGFIIGS